MKRIALLLACVLWLFGCLGSADVTESLYVQSFGFERGETFAYRVVVLTAMPQSGKEGDAKQESRVFSAEARTLYEAIERLNAGLPLRLRFSRTALILIAEPLLRDGKLPELLDFSLGSLDIASDVRVMAVSGALTDLYDGLQSDADPSLSKAIANLDTLAAHAGTVIDARFRTVREAFVSEAFDLVLPLIGTGQSEPRQDMAGEEESPMLAGALPLSEGMPVSVMGSSVFSGTRMAGELTGRHTQMLGMVRGDFLEGTATWYLPEIGTASVRLTRRRRPRVQLSDQDAEITVYLNAELLQPLSAGADDAALSARVAAQIERGLADVFTALQEADADAMGLGRYAILQDPAGKRTDWRARYANLSATFIADVRLVTKDGTA